MAKFNPHVPVHVGVWEPDARAAPRAADGFMVEHASTFNKVLLEFLGCAERAYQTRVAEETQLDEALAG